MHELQLLGDASRAYSGKDIEGAIGYLQALAALLNYDLPQRPFPSRSAVESHKALTRYYFTCQTLLNRQLGAEIKKIRLSYSQPFKLSKPAAAVKAQPLKLVTPQ